MAKSHITGKGTTGAGNVARNKETSNGTTKLDSGASERAFLEQASITAASEHKHYAVEPRVLLDAAGFETGEAVADAASIEATLPASAVSAQETQLMEQLGLEPAPASDAPVEIVFIDAAVEDRDTLIAGIDPSIEIVMLDSDRDGVEQIADALSSRSDVDAIHILSHGRSGTLDLGSTKLTEASMKGRHADEMAVIRNALSQDADILIYGCDFGAKARGASAIDYLAVITGADVAASEDLTGAAALGGDWDLEVETGIVESGLVVSAQAQTAFSGVLADQVIDGSNIQTAAGAQNGPSFTVSGPDGNNFTISRDDTGNITGEAGGAGLGRLFNDALLNGSEDYTISPTQGLSEIDLDFGFINNNADGAEELRNFQVFDENGIDITATATFSFQDTSTGITPNSNGIGSSGAPLVFDTTTSTISGTSGAGNDGGTGAASQGVLTITSSTPIGSVTFTRITTATGQQGTTGAFGTILQGLDYTTAPVPTGDAPTVDLDFIDTVPTPGQDGFTTFDFGRPTITNDGQTEANNGVGNGETAVYENVGLFNGGSVDIRATVVSSTGVNPVFTNSAAAAAEGIANVNISNSGVVDVRWEIFDSATGDPVAADFTLLITDLDAAGNQNNGFRGERISISEDSIDGYVLDDVTDLTPTVNNGVLTFQPADSDPGTPGQDPTNAVQLVFSSTSSFEITYDRTGAANFTFDGNFTPIFNNPQTTDTNPDYGDVFTEGEAPVAIANDTINISDDGNLTGATITLTNPETADRINVPANLPGNITVQSSNDNQIVLTGTGTPDEYEQAILAITFENTSTDPNETTVREIVVAVTDDGGNTSNIATAFMQVVAVDMPTTDLLTSKTLTSGDSEPAVGDQVTFQILVSNVSAENATNVNVTDELPAGLNFDTFNASQGNYDETTGIWAAGDIVAGSFAAITITATVEVGFEGQTITNEVTSVTADQQDSNPNGDDLDETIIVDAAAITHAFVDWTAFDATSISGTLDVGGQQVAVTGTGTINTFQANGGLGNTFTNEGATFFANEARYPDGPSPSDSVGATFSSAAPTFTFSADDGSQLVNPVIYIADIDTNRTYDFGVPFTVLGTPSANLTIDAAAGTVSSSSLAGGLTIQLDGTHSDITITQTAGATDTLRLHLCIEDLVPAAVPDTDGDGIADDIDVDDDNDGILDVIEGKVPGGDISSFTFGDIDVTDSAVQGPFTTDGGVEFDVLFTANGTAGAPSTQAGDGTVLVRANGDPELQSVEFFASGTSDPVALSGFEFVYSDFDIALEEIAFLELTLSDGSVVRFDSANNWAGFVDINGLGLGDVGTNLVLKPNGNLSVNSSGGGGFQDGRFATLDVSDLEIVKIETQTNAFGTAAPFWGWFDNPLCIADADHDSDGDGLADRLDIDSDNDGITDNIEAQTTAGYVAPSGTGDPDNGGTFVDLNRDGLDDNYDTRTVTVSTVAATAADALIDPVNTDATDPSSLGITTDATPDYLDTDSDGDGTSDIVEAGLGAADTDGDGRADIDAGPDTIPGTGDEFFADTDGDGLLDALDTQNGTTANDGFVVNEGLAAGALAYPDADGDASAGVPLTQDVDFRDGEALLDTDGDGIADDIDIDDDNDGILDTVEQGGPVLSGGQIDVQQVLVTAGSANFNTIDSDVVQLTPDANNQAGTVQSQIKLDVTQDFEFDLDINLGSNNDTNLGDGNPFGAFGLPVGGADGIAFMLHNDPAGSNAVGQAGAGIGAFGIQNGLAIEFDTFDNNPFGGNEGGTNTGDHTHIFDTDAGANSSNLSYIGSRTELGEIEDGQFHNVVVRWNADTQTLSWSFDGTQVGSITEDIVNTRLGGDSTAFFGLSASTGGLRNEHQVRLNSYEGNIVVDPPFIDTDGDGIEDYLDIDSDNDGITDNIEAQTTDGYIAPSGVGAGITDANNNGLDDTYEVNNLTGDAVGSLLAPVDTDGDGIADYVDTDSDGDGISDNAENGLGQGEIAFGTLSDTATNDADGDGLFDQYETAIDGNANDGFVVNEGVTDPLTAEDNNNGYLPDDGGDAVDGAVVPLVADLDFRDAEDDNTPSIIDLNGPNNAGFDFDDVFLEDSPGTMVVNLIAPDGVIEDTEDNIQSVTITIGIPAPNDGSDERLLAQFPDQPTGPGGALEQAPLYTIDLSNGQVMGTNPVIIGNTSFNLDYSNNVLTITNADPNSTDLPSADLEALVRLFFYENSSQNNTDGDRTFEFAVTDPGGTVTATTTLTVDRFNDAPVIGEIDPAVAGSTFAFAGETLTDAIVTIDVENDRLDPDVISVSQLLAPLTLTDAEQIEFGVGIVSAEQEDGFWQYLRTDIANAQWTDFGTIPDGEVLLLDPDTEVRFIADAGFTGNALLEYRVWDQTVGTASNPPSTINDDSGGNAPTDQSALSANTVVVSVDVSRDTDGDGVLDVDDIDDDNDGILDIVELGLQPEVTPTPGVPVPFGGTDTAYQTIGNQAAGTAQLFALDPTSGDYLPVGEESNYVYNAAGYDPATDLIYAIVQFGGTDSNGTAVGPSDLVQVDAIGNTYLVGQTNITVPNGFNGFPDAFFLGDVVDGNLIIYTTTATDLLYSVDLATAAATRITTDRPVTGSDFTNVDGVLYGTNGNVLSVTTLTSATTATSADIPITGLPPLSSYGSMWAATNTAGEPELYAFHNPTGDIYRIDGYDTATPNGVLVATGIQPTNTNDGARNPNVPFPTDTGAPDTDNDGIPNYLDIDSDDDGITDNIEAQTTAGFIAPSGTGDPAAGGTFVDVDRDGLDDRYDADTTSTDASASAGLTTVDTDSRGVSDYLENDSDGDGVNDIDENGLGVAYAAGDTDGDGLADVFEAAIDGNVNDGFVVTEGVTDVLNAPNGYLSDTDGDAVAGAITPLSADLDFRDATNPPIIDLNSVADIADTDRDSSALFAQGDTTPVQVAEVISDTTGGGGVENIESLTITPTGLADGASETLTIGGQTITLDGSAQNVTVTVGGTTFTVAANANVIAITNQAGGDIPDADLDALVASIGYTNTAAAVTAGDREFAFVVNDGSADSDPAVATISVTDQPRFECDGVLYQATRTGPDPSQFSGIDLVAGTFNNIGTPTPGLQYNAVGFNNADLFIYGTQDNTNNLVRVGADGSSQVLGAISGLPVQLYTIGDFADDGLLYVSNGRLNGGATAVLYGVNVETQTVERTVPLIGNLPGISDIAFNPVDGLFYGVTPGSGGVDNELISIDPATGVATSVGSAGFSLGPFGAMFADSAGRVFGASNQGNGLFEFDTATATGEFVALAPTGSGNDGGGAFCNDVPLLLPPIIDLNSTAGDTVETGVDFATTYNEGDAPVAVSDIDADAFDALENDITTLTIVLDPATVADGADEVVSIGGTSFPADADATQTVTLASGATADITYVAATGTFTIIETPGGDDVIDQTDLDALVRGVTYQHNSNLPTPGDRTLSFTLTDTTLLDSAPAVATVTVNPLNDAPVAVDDTGITDDNTALTVAVADGIVADNDTDLNGDTLTVTRVASGTDETVLAPLTDGDGVAATVTGDNGGTFTIAADGSYTFDPGTDFDALGVGDSDTTSIVYQIDDGNGGTDTAVVTVTINGAPDAPTLDNDGDDSSGQTGSDFETTFTENLPAVTIVDTDVSITDPEEDIVEVVVTLTDGKIGDTLNVDSTILGPLGISANAAGGVTTLAADGTIIITLISNTTNTNADWEQALQAITFEASTNTPENPDPAQRNVTIQLSDEQGEQSATTNTLINVVPINDIPFLDMNATNVASGGALEGNFINAGNHLIGYVENAGPVDIHRDVVISDLDDTDMQRAIVEFTNPLPEDELLVDGTVVADSDTGTVNGIAYAVTTGAGGELILTFTGTAPIATYDAILESVQYNNTSEDPDTTERVLNVTVTDDNVADSPTRQVFIRPEPVNDAPVPIDPTDPNNPPADPNAVIPAQPGEDSVQQTLDVTPFFTDPDDTVLTYSLDPATTPPWITIDPNTGIITANPPADASQNGPDNDGIYPVTVIATDPDGLTGSTIASFEITNPPPVAVDDAVGFTEGDGTVTGSVFDPNGTPDNDADPDGDTIVVSLVGGDAANLATPAAGTDGGLFTINPDGSFTFDENGEFEDLAVGEPRDTTITYTIDDGQGGTDQATVTVTVTGSNDDPVPVDPNDPNGPADPTDYIPDQTGEDGTAFGPFDTSPFFNDPDTNDTLTFSVPAGALPPGLTIDPNTGIVSGTPDPNASQLGNDPVNAPGIYDVPVTVDDGNGGTFTTNVTLTITNPPPVAEDDALAGDEDTAAPGFDVFANNGVDVDRDPDGDTFSVTRVAAGNDVTALDPLADGADVGTPIAGSNGGLFTLNPDGTLDFDPNGDFEGLGDGESATTEIVYQIDDGEGGIDTATVTYTVNGVNDAPIPVDPTQPPIDPNNPPAGTPFDPQTPFEPPLDPNDYIPAQTGTDDQPSDPLDLTPFFGDPDANDPVTISVDPADLPPGLTFDPTNNTISGDYDPNASQGGDDPVNNPGTYTVPVTATDPSGETFTTNVVFSVDNPPPVAQDDTLTGDEDTVTTNSLFADNGNGVDEDPDGDVFTVTRVNPGSDETVLGPLADGTGVGTPVTGSNGGTFTVQPDGTVEFDPGDDFNGLGVGETAVTEIVYQVDDGQGGTDTAVVTYTVTGVNDAPIPVDPTQPPIDPDNPPAGTPFDPQTPFEPPLDPDNYIPAQTGEDASPLTPLDLTPFFGDPDANDPVVISVDPADLPPGVTFDPTTNTLLGTPDSSASQGGDDPVNNPGVYTIPVTATDPSGETFTTNVTLTITNPPPVAQDDALTGDEDSVVNTSLFDDNGSGEDTDPDGDVFTVTRVAAGNDVTTLGALADGTDVSVPVAGSDGGTFTVNPDGTLEFDPGIDFQDLDVGESRVTEIVYQIDDGEGGTDTAVVSYTVAGLNDAPQVIDPNDPGDPKDPNDPADPDNVIPDQTGNDGEPLTPLDISPFFTDVDDEPLTFGFDPADPDVPSWLQIDPVTGEITGTPPADASQGGPNGDGIYPITVTATDPDGETATTTVDFTVSNLPVIAEDDLIDATEDDPINGSLFDDNGNGEDRDTAPDDDVLTVGDVNGDPANVGQPVEGSDGGSFTINPDGSYAFDPGIDFQDLDVGESRTTTVTYLLTDEQGATDEATVTITVIGANDPPVVIDPNDPGDPNDPNEPVDPNNVIPDVSSNDGDTPATLDVSIYFTDVDDEPLTFDATNLPDGLVIDPTTGEITGTVGPDASQGGDDPVNAPGVYTVTVTASDPDGTSVTTEVTYTVINLPPAAQDDDVTVDEDNPLTGDVFADNGNGADGDTAPDSDPIIVSAVAGDPTNVGQPFEVPTGGTFTINPDGSYSFDPGDDFNSLGLGQTADTSVEYQISDGQGGFDTAVVTVTVTGTNDGPIPVDPTQPPIDPTDPPAGTPFDPQTPYEPPLDPDNYIPVQTGFDSTPVDTFDLTPYFGDPDAPDAVTISVDPADLPPGMMYDPATGVISGTPDSNASQGGDPANPGTYVIPVTATDPSGETFTTNLTIVIENPPPQPVLAIEDFQEVVGNDFTTETADNFEDIDGDDLTFTATGLPQGLTIDPVTGTISGTLDPAAVVDAPNGDGVYTVTVTVDDGEGGTASLTFTFVALDEFVPIDTVVDQSLPLFEVDEVVDRDLSADPIILETLGRIDIEREDRNELARLFGLIEEDGTGQYPYRGGHENVVTVAGETRLRTVIWQDRIYLDVRTPGGDTNWQIEGDPAAKWFDYDQSNLFEAFPAADAATTTVTVFNPELGISVTLVIDTDTGTFKVVGVEKASGEEERASSFSQQLHTVADGGEASISDLLRALG